MKQLKHFLLLLSCLSGLSLSAQDDLLAELQSGLEPTQDMTRATFKTVRIINAHSVELPAPGVLQMNISHRFGTINEGIYDLFGLDRANMRLGFQQGITPHLALGVGRTNIQKTYDGFVKWKILRQQTGKRNVPISVVWLSSMAINTLRFDEFGFEPEQELFQFAYRVNYTHQLLIARKFSDRLSLQLTPAVVHRNLVETNDETNLVTTLGAGGRFKLNGSLTINAEYFYVFPNQLPAEAQNMLSIGIDIETGGHVFQLMFSNTEAMTDHLYLTQTTGRWFGDSWRNLGIHFGFNLMRVFTVSQKAKEKYGMKW